MRKNLVIALIVVVMVGAFAGAGQAALIYADSVAPTTNAAGLSNPTALLGAPDSNYANFTVPGFAVVSFGGTFQDLAGSDVTLYVTNPQTFVPPISLYVHQVGSSPVEWLALTQTMAFDARRLYEIPNLPGNLGASYDMVQLAFSTVGASLDVDAIRVSNLTPYPAAPVPEPGTMMLLGSGLVGLAAYGRKKFRK